MDFTSRYNNLNAAQKKAVDTIDGPVMVIAGPGTGKTELLSMRAANILKQTDTLPGNILCLTFTESGAAAMRERLTHIIGVNAYKVAIHTFHSFGTEVINQNGEFFYHGAHFRAADELSSYELLNTIFDELEPNDPLSSKMNGEYTYLRDSLTTISELKKSGLTSDELIHVLDANDKVIEIAEPLLASIFINRLTKTTADQLQSVITPIRAVHETITLPGITPLSHILADSLTEAIQAASETNSTKPITAWRNSWLKKDEKGEYILKSRERQAKLRAVSHVYYHYLINMQKAELYDFDDMILRVVHAMEVFPELRFNLQEKYQYIMVDEFQDTNMAQMRIIYDLTKNDVNNDKPNILVVGDDDQAIYSFQGADVSNITSFLDLFSETQRIVLTDNYRSSETVLTSARQVITQGSDRLENHLQDLNKTLQAHKPSEDSQVTLVELPTIHDERAWLVESIANTISAGIAPESIAVLARRHHEIIALLPYFADAGIHVNYERRDNVLNLEPIKLIEHIADILVAIYEQRHSDANGLLPELLAHPAFHIEPVTLWQLSLQAQQNHQSWMEIMAITPELAAFNSWLITLAQKLSHEPLEQMLDQIIGIKKDGAPEQDEPILTFVSPLFDYFFSEVQLAENPDLYLTYLEALRTIRSKLREFDPEEIPTIQSFLEFIRLHRQLGSTITSVRSKSARLDSAVNLMTAHKSKGLEFETVYIIGAIDTSWGERVRSRSRLISYPENLPLSPAGDSFDERLRLFFVAMTRAEKNLFMSYSNADENGKGTLRANFLVNDSWRLEQPTRDSTIESLTHTAELLWYQPIIHPLEQSMRDLLAPILENYKLSSTHLNNFLDVTRGGPHLFLMNNLLRFPQAISPSAGYGSAIHATLQRTHAHLTATGKHRPIEDILHDFEENLESQHLSEKDLHHYLQKGSDTLTAFLNEKYASFTHDQKVELNFSHQSVFLGKAHLTGSLDLVDFKDQSVIVTDYKTGKAVRSWTGKTDYEKVKLHRYKQQLMFYNLLILNSRDYNRYAFEKGVLQFVEPTRSGEILAIDATFTPDDLDRFSKLIQVVWRHIKSLDLPDTSAFEPTYKGILEFEQSLLDEL